MAAVVSDPRRTVPDEQRLVLDGSTWDEYVAINDALGERRRVRTIYANGRLTILVTSRRHDWFAECLGDLVKAVAVGFEIDCEPAGQATYRRGDMKAGVEGDRAYYLGANAVLMRGPVNIDLAAQPPPDVAIEVEVCHPAEDALAAWGQIGVPEVWRFDVEAWTFSFSQRQPDGRYQTSDRSIKLPPLNAADVLDQMRLAGELGWSRWNAGLPAWVRGTLVLRRVGGA